MSKEKSKEMNVDTKMEEYLTLNEEFAGALKGEGGDFSKSEIAGLAAGYFRKLWGKDDPAPKIDGEGMMKFRRKNAPVTGPETLSAGMLEIAKLSIDLAMAKAGIRPLQAPLEDWKVAGLFDPEVAERVREAITNVSSTENKKEKA